MTPKEVALSFLNLVTSGRIREAYDQHVAPGFRHHNAYYSGDADSLRKGMEENEGRFPGKTFHVHQVIAEGDRVATHSKVVLKKGELELAVVHIFRIQNGRIAEMWDLGMPIPADSPNENGLF